jgi:hypothetical protein
MASDCSPLQTSSLLIKNTNQLSVLFLTDDKSTIETLYKYWEDYIKFNPLLHLTKNINFLD